MELLMNFVLMPIEPSKRNHAEMTVRQRVDLQAITMIHKDIPESA
jgi:hypothetical protein